MNRQIIFTPEKEASRDLTYSEHSSCQQSIYILLQDRGVANYEFLLKAYRTAISTYLSCHKIESPITFLRNLIGKFDTLARECRVLPDDFVNIGAHILISTGKMYWLLSSDESSIYFGADRIYTKLTEMPDGVVSELPVITGEAQTELFPSSIKDYLRLYAITIPADSDREVVLGCGDQEKHAILEHLFSQRPAASMAGNPLKQYLPLKYLNRKVMVISFSEFKGRIGDRLPDHAPMALVGASHRSIPTLALYVLIVAMVIIASIWGVTKLTSDAPPQERLMQAGVETSPVAASGGGAAVQDAPAPPPASNDTAARIAISPVWDRSFKDAVTSSPVVSDGYVIFGCRDGHLYSLDALSGAVAWDYNSSAGIGASPAIAGDRVVCANYQGDVFSLGRRDGSRIWNTRLPGKISSSPCVAGDRVIVGCYDTIVYCLSLKNGEIVWKFDSGGAIRSTPAASESRIIVASYDGYLYALSPADGSTQWRYQIGGNIDSSPVLSGETVFIGAPDGTIHAVAAESGTVLWKTAAAGPVKSGLAASSTSVFAGSNDGALYCIDRRTGALTWKYATGDIILARPVITPELVFVASYDGMLYIISSGTGVMVDSYATGKQIFSSPCIDSDRIYFGNNAGSFFCIRYLQNATS